MAARELAEEVRAGRIDADEVTADSLGARMPSLAVGDPDLVIRTGGERRISNFLLYGLAYAELHFADVLWPEFSERDLFEAIASFQHRERRFGRVGTGVHAPSSGTNGESPTLAAASSTTASALTRLAV
jgi:undecaprenyl diphosphate synthase